MLPCPTDERTRLRLTFLGALLGSMFVVLIAPHSCKSSPASGSRRGLQAGVQNAVGYVPENHTDFVFTVVGMTIGLVPVVGLPLPLVSYGGTSLVASLAMIGLMASVHRASQ